VLVNMTAAPKKTPSAKVEDSGLQKVKSIIAVSSCKGGVGKSTVAACLAREVAQRGFKVGLLDIDLFGPSIPTLFNCHGASVKATKDKKYIPLEVDQLKIMSFGFLIGDSPAVMRGPMVSGYAQQLLHRVDWGELDYLFIDFPPGTGDTQLTIAQSIQLDGALIISTRQALSLVDVSKGILMFEKVNVPILGVIENMVYFTCDDCSKKHFLFGGTEESELSERFGIETLGQLPFDLALSHHLEKPRQSEIIREVSDQVIRAIGKNTIKQESIPEISFDAKQVTLSWPEGTKTTVANSSLRASCRCAMCVEEATGRQLLKKENIRADIKAEEVSVLGNYAIAVKWSDGHTSGIYPYKRIKELNEGQVASELKP